MPKINLDDAREFIRSNTPRRKIFTSIAVGGEGYLSQLSRDLKINKRTILLQLLALEKQGLIFSEWITKHIGETDRPIWLKSFKTTPKFKTLSEEAKKGLYAKI